MRFHLKVYRAAEGVTALELEAADLAAARRQAQTQGYRVVASRTATHFSAERLRTGRGFSVPLFSQELLALLEAGMGVVESVAILARKARHPEAKRILEELHRLLGEGRAFSRALEGIPGAFPMLFVATVKASEQTSNLPEALHRYLAYRRQLNGVRDKMLAAAVYPLLLIGIGTLVVLFLLIYVVPRFSKVYDDVGRDHLPALSRLLMDWGRFASDHAAMLGVGVLVGIAALLYALTRPGLRAAIERRLWRLPAVGERFRIYQLARFTRTVAMLLKGGVPLVTALDMTGELLRQPSLQAGLEQAKRAIREGRAVSDAFDAHGLATDVGTRLLVVGERSGELGEAMERIAGFYDEDIARAVEWVSRLFEPALMVFIGLLIGGIVVLMYLPIFELASSIQ